MYIYIYGLENGIYEANDRTTECDRPRKSILAYTAPYPYTPSAEMVVWGSVTVNRPLHFRNIFRFSLFKEYFVFLMKFHCVWKPDNIILYDLLPATRTDYKFRNVFTRNILNKNDCFFLCWLASYHRDSIVIFYSKFTQFTLLNGRKIALSKL